MTEFAITLSEIVLGTSFLYQNSGRMSSRTCYAKLSFYFSYVRSLSLGLNTYTITVAISLVLCMIVKTYIDFVLEYA